MLTLGLANDRWFSFTIREDRLGGVTIGSTLTLETAAGDRVEAKVTELRPLGEFAVWRAARAVGDHDLNNFLLRADPIGPTPQAGTRYDGLDRRADEGVGRRLVRPAETRCRCSIE